MNQVACKMLRLFQKAGKLRINICYSIVIQTDKVLYNTKLTLICYAIIVIYPQNYANVTDNMLDYSIVKLDVNWKQIRFLLEKNNFD